MSVSILTSSDSIITHETSHTTSVNQSVSLFSEGDADGLGCIAKDGIAAWRRSAAVTSAMARQVLVAHNTQTPLVASVIVIVVIVKREEENRAK